MIRRPAGRWYEAVQRLELLNPPARRSAEVADPLATLLEMIAA